MPKSEDQIIDSLGDQMSPAERAETRHALRMLKLQVALNKEEEPAETFVLATSDGRTIEVMPDKTLGLDVGDKPKHWSQDRANELAERWNRTASPKDHVNAVYWREHYRAHVERLKNR